MTVACAKPDRPEMRRDPEEMGLTLAFSTAAPQDASGEEAEGRMERIAPSDGELLQRVGSGDSGAFELLYRRCSRPVLRCALRRLGHPLALQHARQESFGALRRA